MWLLLVLNVLGDGDDERRHGADPIPLGIKLLVVQQNVCLLERNASLDDLLHS